MASRDQTSAEVHLGAFHPKQGRQIAPYILGIQLPEMADPVES
jgi:hypothetical protein